MSFLGGFKNVGKVLLGIATNPATSTIISLFNPALGALVGRISNAVVNIEAAHAQAGKSGTGPEKLSFVMTDFNESLAVTQEVLKLQNKQMTYDGKALEDAINAQVAALNAANKLKESFKIIDIPASTS